MARFARFPHAARTALADCAMETHVVNNAMAIRSGGVWCRQSGADADRRSVFHTIAMLDTYHGQASGVFTGDEHLAGLNPSQGAELCAVVEYMFSLEVLSSITGRAGVWRSAGAHRLQRAAGGVLA